MKQPWFTLLGSRFRVRVQVRRCRSRFCVLGIGFVFPSSRVALRRDLGGALAEAGRFVLATAVALLIVASSLHTIAAQGSRGGPIGNVATGQTFYTKSGCDACHGPLGRGTSAGPSIAGTPRQLPDFIAYVRKPAGAMPAQNAQVVSDQVLADIYLFLHAAAVQLGEPTSTPAGRAENGAMLYRKVGCYQCHADQAQGGQAGPRIGPDPIPFARFVQYVRNPAGQMPPYTDKVVSGQDLSDIYAFLQARPRPPAVNAIPQLEP